MHAAVLLIATLVTSQGSTQEWSPPSTSIPGEYIKAFQALLGNGIADPRGGTLSRVEVEVGRAGFRGSDWKLATGWVMPGGKRVVLINGLEHDVIRVERSLRPFEPVLGQAEPGALFIDDRGRGGWALPGLLLMTGRVTEAQQAFAALGTTAKEVPHQLVSHVRNANRFQVALTLGRGDDASAEHWAKQLLRASEAGQPFLDPTVHARSRQETPAECQALLEDIQRRLREGKGRPNLEQIARMPRAERITALVAALDEVSAVQVSQPGGVSWMFDPILQAFAREEEAAIPAVIDVILHDRRFTRSASYARDFFPERSIQPVRNAAIALLHHVCPISTSIEDTAALRDTWARMQGKSQAEQWLAILADDKGGGKAWLLAAEKLTAPPMVRTAYGYGLAKPGTPILGEEIRAQHGATFERLIHQRATAMVPSAEPPHDSMKGFMLGDAVNLMIRLRTWNPQALKGEAASFVDHALRYLEAGGYGGEYTSFSMARLLTLRVQAGDPKAVDDFVRMADLARFDTGFDWLLVPLWNCPDDPGVQAASQRLLERAVSAVMATRPAEIYLRAQYVAGLYDTPAVGLRPVREALAELLASELVLGQVEITPAETGRVAVRAFSSQTGDDAPGGEMRLGTFPLTLGDWMAWRFEKGFISLPDEPRDVARKALIDRLLRDDEAWMKRARAYASRLPQWQVLP